jgi:hypothetical protein
VEGVRESLPNMATPPFADRPGPCVRGRTRVARWPGGWCSRTWPLGTCCCSCCRCCCSPASKRTISDHALNNRSASSARTPARRRPNCSRAKRWPSSEPRCRACAPGAPACTQAHRCHCRRPRRLRHRKIRPPPVKRRLAGSSVLERRFLHHHRNRQPCRRHRLYRPWLPHVGASVTGRRAASCWTTSSVLRCVS